MFALPARGPLLGGPGASSPWGTRNVVLDVALGAALTVLVVGAALPARGPLLGGPGASSPWGTRGVAGGSRPLLGGRCVVGPATSAETLLVG